MTMLVLFGFLLLGAASGAVHFAIIAWEARLTVAGGAAMLAAVARIGRLVLTVAALALAAVSGWPALLSASLGLMAGRQWALYRFGRPA